MKNDVKMFLIASLIYIVFALLATTLLWVFVKTNTLSFIALLITAWLLFLVLRKPKNDPKERLKRLRSILIQGLISEEEFQILSSENSEQYRELTAGGSYHWMVILRFDLRNILKTYEKRLRNLETYCVKEEISEEDYQTIRKTILRNL